MKRILMPALFVTAFVSGAFPATAAEPDETPLPGLWQTKNFDQSSIRRELGPVMGTVSGNYTSPLDGFISKWAEYDCWSYEGEMFMEAGKTYVFGSYIDDFCDVLIDGRKVYSQNCYEFGTGAYDCSSTGWHPINIVVWDIGGGFGANISSWSLGIAWNTTGQTTQEPSSGWTQLMDPGDGSLFRAVIHESNGSESVFVKDVVAVQRYPWNGMVDIDYEVVCDDPDADVWVYATGMDNDMNVSMAPRTLTGDGVDGPVKAGKHRMTWNVTADYPGFAAQSFTVKMCALVGGAPYLVVDLSGGVDALSYPVSYLNSVPEGGWGDDYKTTKMAFRLIPPGTFTQGSPSDELGRNSYETQRPVCLTKPFYMAVFECTQKQYELVMGSNPSTYKGDKRPVERVSYDAIRGTVNGAAWPAHNQVDANSFMGRLRAKANMVFDLPTEAQWEYACRAGTGSALNNGKNLQYTGTDANLAEVGRYKNDQSDGKGGYASYHTSVGSYLPNAWGLYDMHGNVWEWCLNWNSNYAECGLDPKGPSSGSSRVYRGGSWSYSSQDCRSAWRKGNPPGSMYADSGFRVACLPAD